MREVTGQSISEIYKKVCTKLITAPVVVARGLATKELMGVKLCLTNPRARFVTQRARDMDIRYCVGELCYFLDGRTDLASIYHYSKFWAKVSDDGKTVNSAYGHRLFYVKNKHENKQLMYIIDTLLDDPSSRKAVMPIYDKDDAHESKDNPCTMYMQFMIRDNKLHCHVYMRSNDVWLGLPYDVAFFTLVQEIVYMSLLRKMPGLELGSYFHNAGSLHAYEQNWLGVEQCAEERSHLGPITYLTYVDVDNWFNDLLTFEKAQRGVVHYKNSGPTTCFQLWCKAQLTNKA